MSKEPTTNSQGLSEEYHAMISRISHEVRNPVAVIHSFHQLLLLAHPELSNDLYFQKIQENMAFLNSCSMSSPAIIIHIGRYALT